MPRQIVTIYKGIEMESDPTELEITIAAPFRHMRKESLSWMEFLFYYTQDKRWMNSEQVKTKLLPLAEEAGYISRDAESGKYFLADNLKDVKIAMGFRPTDAVFTCAVPVCDPFDALLADISRATGKDEHEIAGEIEVVRKHFDGQLYAEAAIVILAKKYGVATAKYQSALLKRITE
ncbi:MAG TPA: DUF2240 family protein [Methanocorpusculum sp.]|nr:DUF2240 family protein [Methanocorpusculum sp.]